MSYTPITAPKKRTPEELQKIWEHWGRHPDFPNNPTSRPYWEWAADADYEYKKKIYTLVSNTPRRRPR